MAATDRPADEMPRWVSITGAALWVILSAKTIRITTDDLEAMMRPVPSTKDW